MGSYCYHPCEPCYPIHVPLPIPTPQPMPKEPAELLPPGADPQTAQELLDAVVANAPPGEGEALQALVDQLGRFNTDNSAEFILPFLLTLANNPGAVGAEIPANASLDETMAAIVESLPPELKPLMANLQGDIAGSTSSARRGGPIIVR